MTASIFSISQIGAGDSIMENNFVIEFAAFKVKDPSKGIEIARAIIGDARAFNDGIIADEVYQSVNDPNTIIQRITWKSLEKAKEAFAAFDTFPSASIFFEQSEGIIFFDHFKQVKYEH
jgi:hypothetical protein